MFRSPGVPVTEFALATLLSLTIAACSDSYSGQQSLSGAWIDSASFADRPERQWQFELQLQAEWPVDDPRSLRQVALASESVVMALLSDGRLARYKPGRTSPDYVTGSYFVHLSQPRNSGGALLAVTRDGLLVGLGTDPEASRSCRAMAGAVASLHDEGSVLAVLNGNAPNRYTLAYLDFDSGGCSEVISMSVDCHLGLPSIAGAAEDRTIVACPDPDAPLLLALTGKNGMSLTPIADSKIAFSMDNTPGSLTPMWGMA